MKKVLLLVMIFISFSVLSQDDKSSSLLYIMSPGSLDDGYSFGLQLEHIGNSIYVGPELYIFPDLNGIDYLHLIGRFGYNNHLGNYNRGLRIYLGGRGGILRRGGNGYALLGFEGGIDYVIPNSSLFIRLSIARDFKTDSKLWSRDDNHRVDSGIVGIGFKF